MESISVYRRDSSLGCAIMNKIGPPSYVQMASISVSLVVQLGYPSRAVPAGNLFWASLTCLSFSSLFSAAGTAYFVFKAKDGA